MTGMTPARRLLRRFIHAGAPAALIALPIIAAGLLAWSAAQSDHAAAAARRMEAAALRLSALAEKLDRRARDFAALAVAAAASARTLEDLHGLVARGELVLVASYLGERRLFPPEDSAGLTAAEARALAALGPALTATRRRLATDGFAWGRGAAPGGAALLVCRRDGANVTEHCAAAAESALREVAAAELAGLAAPDGWRFALLGPDDVADDSSTPIAEQTLGGPLHGWRLQAFAAAADSDPGRAGLLYLLIGLPSAALWAAGALRFHQSRRARLAAQMAAEIEEGRRRAELAAQLSHDLRTPLANLRLYADLIRRRADDPAAVIGYADVVEAEIDRLDAIAGAAVAAATGENTAEALRPAVIDPLAALAELAARAAPRMAAAGCDFSLIRDEDGGDDNGDGGDDGRTGTFDVAVLARIMTNLLDNAGKFAAGRPVAAQASRRGGVVTLTVRDYGPGLAGADPARRGAGLGLTAAARLAALHGGALRLEDARPGLRVIVTIRSLMETGEAPPCAC